jgi:hypothetical protein
MNIVNNYSYKHLILLLGLVLVVFRFFFEPLNILTWDVFGYYLYLPAKYIYHDLSLSNQEWLTNLISAYDPTATLYQAIELDNGNWVMKYTMGLSILYSPFFFLAHLIAEPLGYPADGLSLPYQYSIAIGGLIYAIIGLIFFSKVLLHFFSHFTTCIILVIIFFGTNYFQLTAFDGTLLSHNFLFTFYAILTYYTIEWYKKQKLKYAIIIGLSVGFITLIRPSEVVCILIPLLWYSKQNFHKNKFELFKTHFSHLITVITCIFIVLLPQFLYWKSITGQYLFYSYTNAGEGLDLISPYIIKFLFSFRKGWFVYTPVMIFSFIGLYYLYKKNRPVFFAISAFIIVDIYITSSWTTWWYAGGSYSSRSLVPAYVLLAIPLGYFIEKVKLASVVSRFIVISIGLFFITLNLFQTWQFENNVISKERMTMEYYFAIFGKTKVCENDKKLLLVERSVETFEHFINEEDYNKKILYQNFFGERTDATTNTKGVFIMDENNTFSPGIDIKYKDLTDHDHAWIQGSARVFIPEKYNEEPPLLIVSFHYKNKPYHYRALGIKKEEIKYNEWNEIKIDYLTPEVRTKEDNLKVYLWHRGKKKVLLDDLIVYIYEPKR